MSSQNLSRRALAAGLPVLAVAAALPQPAAASSAASIGEPGAVVDPTFAAIARHRKALLHRFEAGNISFRLPAYTPEYDAADEANGVAIDAEIAAQEDLICTVPTSMAGVLALFDYVDDLCTNEVALPENPRNWHSDSEFLMDFPDDHIVSRFDGKPIELPFLFWVVRNASLALQTLAVQS